MGTKSEAYGADLQSHLHDSGSVTQQWRQKGGRGAKEQEKEAIKCEGGGAAGVQLDEEVATGTEGERSNIWLGRDIYWGR